MTIEILGIERLRKRNMDDEFTGCIGKLGQSRWGHIFRCQMGRAMIGYLK